MSSPIVIQLEGLSHSYGDRRALHDVSLTVRKGEILGLLGPNGGGKTTLFRLLSTLMPIQSGKAKVLSHDLSKGVKAVRPKIGIVFQSPSLDKKLTVYENLRHQGHLYGLYGADLAARIKKLLDEFGLIERRDDLTEKLSGGLKRRVEVAKGLLHDPEILFLDEPSTGIDPGARIDLWNYLKKLRDERKVTLVVTTHLMDEAEKCDHLGILDQGVLRACDTPTRLKALLGGSVINVTAEDPEKLHEKIRSRSKVASSLVQGMIRIEHAAGEATVLALMRDFSSEITSFTVQKPTLEDVFIHLTGRQFGEEKVQ